MKSFLFLFIFPVLLVFSGNAASQERTNSVTDLLPEWSFPKGIEGPAIDKNGNLFAVNFKEPGTIGVVTPNGEASVYVTLPSGSVGNGIRFDKKGFMYIADYTMHNILRVDPSSKEISVFAHNSSMNQPNDIAISPKTEFLYASDPNWKDSTGNLWLINREGKIILLEGNIGTTNGVEVSPDGKKLYVNESIQRKVWVYDIKKDGTVENKKLLISFPDFGMDGMRCNSEGNLFITRHGKGTVVIVSPNGVILREILLKGKLCSNIVLSRDEKRAYVTMADRGCFEVIDLN
ncbi:MAG: SMP-30/gluconolactonase/LRE family protein [Bacteroidales bacterium]|nr:SMP-30/gluconolactonase/LRE family protein [Bacteroidales bacterium]NTV18449.1 SMP-30/gluconolactonase/LRE family protein [Bacteroidales bacterium]